MPKKQCLDCKKLFAIGTVFVRGDRNKRASRCRECQARRDRDYRMRDRGGRARREAAIAAWVAEHGHICPGYRVEPHPSDDLTADHVTPLVAGGGEFGELQVLCRSCNGRKAGR